MGNYATEQEKFWAGEFGSKYSDIATNQNANPMAESSFTGRWHNINSAQIQS
ncbi:hypothetical protein [Thalassoporum mexicanum]|uniref:hypothetical protein n=1 Tax=Thalassoporum mexicanum TaxID=3457544 RepID=UPI0030DA8DE7